MASSSGNDPLKSPVKLASRVPEPALCKRFVSHIPWLRNCCRLSARLRSGHWRDREKKYLVRLIQLRFSELWPTYASLSNRLNYQTGKASSERGKNRPDIIRSLSGFENLEAYKVFSLSLDPSFRNEI